MFQKIAPAMAKKILLFSISAFLFLGVSAQKNPTTPTFKKDSINIQNNGAVPDGNILNTKPIQASIDQLHQRGGGVVMIPQGLWLTGPLTLKSNINLHLEQGATLLFTKDFDQYPLAAVNWEGLPQMRNQSPISATGATNIGITGSGIIDGNGDAWRMVKKDKLNETQWKKLVASGGILSDDKKVWYPSVKSLKGSKMSNPGVIEAGKDAAFYNSIKDFLRPNLLLLTECNTILLEGVTFQNSAAWCLHPLMSENIFIKNITVKNPWYAQNGDGIDLESCKNVIIENSVFDVGDDALCMKSGRNAEGRKRDMPTENVIITGCTVYSSHGGFVIGSEMSGGVRNILVSNCTFIGADIGLRFKTTRGRGGIVENIAIKDIYMKDIPGEAILFDMYYEAKDPIPLAGEKRELPKVEFKPVDETTPIFRNFHISNVYCNGAQKAIFIRGLPEMHVQNIVLENMVLQSDKGIDIQEASSVTLKNIKVFSKNTNPVVDIVQSDKITFDNIEYNSPATQLFRISGERSQDITILHTNTSNALKKISFELGAQETSASFAQDQSTESTIKWSQEMATTAMKIWPDSFLIGNDKAAKWRYDQGVVLKGIESVWNATGDGKWFKYIQQCMDFYVNNDGTIKGYKHDEYNIDHVNNGKLLLLLYQVTGKEKYRKAAALLRDQLKTHPRTTEGGFWHKKIYPWQMWLDGLYMGQPFYAEYAKIFNDDTAFNDIARQFILMEKRAIDKKTGLLYHGWDESKEQQWADKQTGQSPNFWGRSLGWYGMALVDVLDYFPENHPKRKELIQMLQRFATAVVKVQDPKTGLWYDVPNLPGKEKNYPEASASCMLIYTLAKGVRKGYLSSRYITATKAAYNGVINHFIEIGPDGQVNLTGTVSVSGLGGKPYRDGSFEYYMSEPVVENDPKGMGAFILCAAEMEIQSTQSIGKNKVVLLDNYFNNEWKKDAAGNNIRFHYIWEDKSNSGYAMLGEIFQRYGTITKSLNTAPSSKNLKEASIYMIVDPDTEKETETPNYIDERSINAISNWVKKGGTLVLLGNDAGNAEFKNFNKLAGQFGIRFNEDSKNRVQNDQFEQGAAVVPTGNSLFDTPHKLYVKEYSSLEVKDPAITVLKNADDKLMAVAKYGKGTVFALGDPWIYNEYLDGRKLPAEFDNYKAAEEWVKWLIKQTNKK
ncbi:MAG TPA: glycoside hydrolase family 88 protein [Chitinophagaceae bacterium]|nr:glycoside hydrolase family 88 protein [Chitinophagaceae bacterium]